MVKWLQTRAQRELAGKIEASRERLYRIAFAWSHDAALADDLAQEALARGLARIGQLREAERLSSWLFSILHRCWIDHLRGRRDDLDEEALAELPCELPGPDGQAEAQETARRVRAAIEALPLGQRQVLTLVDLEQFTYAEVAEALAIPIGTVMSRLCRAREAARPARGGRGAAAPEEREMNDKRTFSDEQLNAFVDDQLGAQEREEILAAAAEDAELGQRLCALRAAKELVGHAYGRLPAARHRTGRRVSLWSGALVAGLALAVGVVAGWQGHRASQGGTDITASLAGLFAPQPSRVLIHLDSSQTERMQEALDMAEAYLAKAGKAKVELVVNNSGLDLLREETTPMPSASPRWRRATTCWPSSPAAMPSRAIAAPGWMSRWCRKRGWSAPPSSTSSTACARAGLT